MLEASGGYEVAAVAELAAAALPVAVVNPRAFEAASGRGWLERKAETDFE